MHALIWIYIYIYIMWSNILLYGCVTREMWIYSHWNEFKLIQIFNDWINKYINKWIMRPAGLKAEFFCYLNPKVFGCSFIATMREAEKLEFPAFYLTLYMSTLISSNVFTWWTSVPIALLHKSQSITAIDEYW